MSLCWALLGAFAASFSGPSKLGTPTLTLYVAEVEPESDSLDDPASRRPLTWLDAPRHLDAILAAPPSASVGGRQSQGHFLNAIQSHCIQVTHKYLRRHRGRIEVVLVFLCLGTMCPYLSAPHTFSAGLHTARTLQPADCVSQMASLVLTFLSTGTRIRGLEKAKSFLPSFHSLHYLVQPIQGLSAGRCVDKKRDLILEGPRLLTLSWAEQWPHADLGSK